MKKFRIASLFTCALLLVAMQLRADAEATPVVNQEIGQEQVVETGDLADPDQSSTEEKKYFSAGNESTIDSQIEFLQACRSCGDKEEERKYENSSLNFSKSAALTPTTQALRTNPLKQSSSIRGYYTTHKGVILYPLLVGGEVQLDDYSVWTIEPVQSYYTLNWSVVDQIVVRANHTLWGQYKFILENIDKNFAVDANLSKYLDPMYHGVKNYTIIDIDPIGCMIWLSDGSVWLVDWWDFTTRWKRGHTIIVGINDGYKSQTEPNILINASLIQYVRASCIR